MTNLHLWLDPSFGASGDMMLGTLVGLGAPLQKIVRHLEPLDVPDWSLRQSTVSRCSLQATRVAVAGHDDQEGRYHHRTWSSIDRLLADSDLPPAVKIGARSSFRRLAEVEAEIHGIDVDQVHFHEVGAVDAIIDIVGSWLALDLLAVTSVSSGPVGVGSGIVMAAHGLLPVPAPATSALLLDAPVRAVPDTAPPSSSRGETITPTGAALLSTMAADWGPMPSGVLRAMARGAGARDPQGHPNVLTGYLIETDPVNTVGEAVGEDGSWTDTSVTSTMIQTNLDDVPGEVVAHTIDRCLQAGADDAWARPVVMKKGRPGVELLVLCRPDLADGLRRLVALETGTLGCRTMSVTKYELPRRFETVYVGAHPVSIKVGPHGAKPEFDQLAAAASALGLPVREVSRRALALFHKAETGHD